MTIALVIAVIAMAVAIGSWFRSSSDGNTPSSDTTPKFSEQEVATAKNEVCAAHEAVRRATNHAGSQTSPDPVATLVIAVNVRVGATVSADYLRQKLAANPATPPELARAVEELALAFQDTTLLHIAEAPEKELDPVYARLDEAGEDIVQACDD